MKKHFLELWLCFLHGWNGFRFRYEKKGLFDKTTFSIFFLTGPRIPIFISKDRFSKNPGDFLFFLM